MAATMSLASCSCTTCDLNFSNQKTLRKHRAELHSPSFSCSTCSMTFSQKRKLRIHNQEMHSVTHSCKKCTLVFPTKKLRLKHTIEEHPRPFDCSLCDSTFSDERKVRIHKLEVHPSCKHCSMRYRVLEELRNHQAETGHLHCQECDIYFPNNGEHIKHFRNAQHTTEYKCCDCDREYPGQEALNNHCCDCDKIFLTDKILTRHFSKAVHLRKLESLAAGAQVDENMLPRCKKCNEEFGSKKILKKHVAAMHKSLRNIPCPMGAPCVKKFASPSALLSHLESGGCRAGMTRAKLSELVFAHDPNRYITSPGAAHMVTQEATSTSEIANTTSMIPSPRHQLVEDFASLALRVDDDDDNLSEWSLLNENNGVLLTPTSEIASEWSLIQGGGAQLTPDLLSANISEWSFASEIPVSNENQTTTISHLNVNPSFPFPTQTLSCALCPPTRAPFSSPKAFQAHLASAAHAPKIFHCPISFMTDFLHLKEADLQKLRNKKFSTLSGLTQHLESGACEGGVEVYRKALEFVEVQMVGLGFAGGLLLGGASS